LSVSSVLKAAIIEAVECFWADCVAAMNSEYSTSPEWSMSIS
jgi:hypothetical protein